MILKPDGRPALVYLRRAAGFTENLLPEEHGETMNFDKPKEATLGQWRESSDGEDREPWA